MRCNARQAQADARADDGGGNAIDGEAVGVCQWMALMMIDGGSGRR